MPKIFISYRQKDSRGDSRQLYNRLAESFGAENVFFDVSKIGPGDDWLEVVRRKVRSCQVLIAVIGERWLAMDDGHGNRRLDDAEDPVRIEIAAALGKNIRVIPILLDRAEMPKAAQLPADIRKLSRCTAHEVRHKSFDRDVDALIEALGGSADAEREVGTETTGDFWSQLGKNLSESLGKRLGDALGDKLTTSGTARLPPSSPPQYNAPVVPDYTPPAPPPLPNLAGQWGSSYGIPHMIQQSGNTIAIQAVDAFGRTMMQGQGTIMGNVVEIAYTAYMPPFPTQGRARLEISPDGRRLRGQTVNFQTRMTNYIELFR
jgi:TIR domain